MPTTDTEKAVCEKCGSDVREGTTFCYNCGEPIVATAHEIVPEIATDIVEEKEAADDGSTATDDKTRSALDDLAERLRLDEDADKKLAKAAAERKKARVGQRKSTQFTWESSEDSSGGMLVVVALLITGLAGAIVFLTLFSK